MATPAHHPQTVAERLIVRTIEWTWLLWLVGGLYIAGPALGWVLAAMVATSLYLGRSDITVVPRPVLVWLGSMAIMLIILWIGHFNFDLGPAKTLKSSIGWAKGWALIALFPLAGAMLAVRPEVIYRAVCRLGLVTLILLPIFLFAPSLGLPERLWVSPLKIVGGAGTEYFAAQLFTIEPGIGRVRWQFFAPWSPAAGMMGVIYVYLAAKERNLFWKTIGITAGVALAILSQSRVAYVALVMVAPMVWVAARLNRGYLWMAAAPAMLALGFFGPALLELIDSFVAEFYAARADSSRVRATLARIAIDRWQNEAYWFGHGIVENGPHLVKYMPIGSHHSWYGLLFVKGLTGAIALAVPLTFTAIYLALRSSSNKIARIGLAMVIFLILYSMSENLEMLAYLYWPALIMIGIAFRPICERAAISG